MNLEIKIVRYFNHIGKKNLEVFLTFVNSIRFLAFFWMLVVVLAVIRHPEITKTFIGAVLIVAVLHFSITEGIIKHWLTRFLPKRKRPYVAYPDLIKPTGRKLSDSSFPSSHVTTTAAMLFVIISFYPSLTLLSIGMILLMAFSRLSSGMHYMSDVVAGALIGFAYGYAALFLVRILFN